MKSGPENDRLNNELAAKKKARAKRQRKEQVVGAFGCVLCCAMVYAVTFGLFYVLAAAWRLGTGG